MRVKQQMEERARLFLDNESGWEAKIDRSTVGRSIGRSRRAGRG
jgi:hypothetical protein